MYIQKKIQNSNKFKTRSAETNLPTLVRHIFLICNIKEINITLIAYFTEE
jgi:hypothetical protein